MNFTIILANSLQEIVNSSIVNKLYDLFIINRANHTISLLGYLYSPTAYGEKVDELNYIYSPEFRIDVPTNGRFIQFLPSESSLESTIKTVLGISLNDGITEVDAANALFTGSTFAGTYGNPNTSLTSFSTFRYFTLANNRPPDYLFSYCTNLTTIDLSNVTQTSLYEFSSSGLTGDLSLPNLTSLGIQSFGGTKISTVSSLGNSITLIPNYCFRDCANLTSVTLPTTVEQINLHAFSAYNTYYLRVFTTITGLNNVTVFGLYAFYDQTALNITASDINLATRIDLFAFFNVPITGVLNLKNLVSLGISAFEKSRFSKVLCLGKLSAIPRSIFYIDNNNQYSNSLTEVYIPNECTSIERYAFHGRSGLTTIKQYTQSIDDWIDDTPSSYRALQGIVDFGDACFKYCRSLLITASELEDSVSIGESSFEETLISGSLNLTKLSTLKTSAFRSCSYLTGVSCLGVINEIPTTCFMYDSALLSVYIPYECTSIQNSAFNGCRNLTTIKLYSQSINNWINNTPSTFTNDLSRITSFGIECFKDCPLLLLTNDDLLGATSIGRGAFAGRISATNLSLPNLLGTLGSYAFSGNTSLQTVSNLGSITEIGGSAFSECTSLTSITFPTSLTQVGASLDDGTSIEKEIFPYGLTVHGGGFCRHKTATTCKYIQLPSTITIISLWDFARDAWSNPIRCKIIIQATTPPGNEWSPSNTGGFGNGYGWGRPYMADFYVPDVNTYLAHPHWAHEQEVAIQEGVNNGNGNIFPISLLLTDDPDLWAVYLQNKDYGVPQNNS